VGRHFLEPVVSILTALEIGCDLFRQQVPLFLRRFPILAPS
jgi:hypothetical protein